MVNVEVLFKEVLRSPHNPELQSELMGQVVRLFRSYFITMPTFPFLATCRCHGGWPRTWYGGFPTIQIADVPPYRNVPRAFNTNEAY